MLEKGKIRVKDIKSMKTKKSNVHTCKICNEIFSNEKKLIAHRKEHKPKEGNVFKYKYTFEESLKQYVCRTCEAEFATVEEIEKHIEIHEEKYKCTFCTDLFSDPFKYAVHLYTHTKDIYNCPLCSMKTTHRNSLYNHINKMHLRKYYLYCKYCGKGFSDNLYLKEHLETHETGLQHTCIVCKKDFPYSRYLYLHQTRCHRVNIDGTLLPNQCGVCYKVFTKAISLERHIKTLHEKSITREKKILCDICGKAFAQNDKLKLHYRVHTGDKPFSCKYCQKRFTKKDYLIMHERIHSGEKPYSCEHCGKCFNQSASLRIHIRTHTGEKPYVCHICNNGFTSKAGLNLHFKKCTG